MLLADIQAAVDTITNRPELVNERNLAIQEATLMLHGIENWWRDLIEQPVTFSASAFFQQIPLSSLPRFRIFSYIRRYDPTATDPSTGQPTGAMGKYFDPVAPGKVLDSYKLDRDYVYYLSGGGGSQNAVCQLRSYTAFQYLMIGWFGFPIVSPIGQYYSWIAELYPYAIITQAAMKLKKYITETDAVKALEGDAASHMAALLTGGLEFQGR